MTKMTLVDVDYFFNLLFACLHSHLIYLDFYYERFCKCDDGLLQKRVI
jgi:hypothetical protein